MPRPPPHLPDCPETSRTIRILLALQLRTQPEPNLDPPGRVEPGRVLEGNRVLGRGTGCSTGFPCC